jgi:hypothetical protein
MPPAEQVWKVLTPTYGKEALRLLSAIPQDWAGRPAGPTDRAVVKAVGRHGT